MFDTNRHKYFLVRILKDVYSDTDLANFLGFKGGTAHMLFYDLPRFSVDIDFNLIEIDKTEIVYEKTRNILLKYGNIKDEAKKYYGIIFLHDYGKNERNLKIEISNRNFPDSYEIKDFLGIPIKVMKKEDMLSHKLCALTDRQTVANRDIFDIYHFLSSNTQLNQEIIHVRTGMDVKSYIDKCIKVIEYTSASKLIYGLGELLTEDLKKFVRQKLKSETIQLLKLYQEFAQWG